MKKSIKKQGLSLRGFSGILTGIYAIVGALIINTLLENYQNASHGVAVLPISFLEYLLVAVMLVVFILSITTTFIIAYRRAKKSKQKLWHPHAKKRSLYFTVVLLVGLVFCVVLYHYQLIKILLPSTLIFYGLACISVQKYTANSFKYLGFAFVTTGLLAAFLNTYGLPFWAFGFGALHIFYGIYTSYAHSK